MRDCCCTAAVAAAVTGLVGRSSTVPHIVLAPSSGGDVTVCSVVYVDSFDRRSLVVAGTIILVGRVGAIACFPAVRLRRLQASADDDIKRCGARVWPLQTYTHAVNGLHVFFF